MTQRRIPESSGGGGVSRSVRLALSVTGDGRSERVAFITRGVTDPQEWFTNPPNITSDVDNAWQPTNATVYSGTTTLTVPSTYWVDMFVTGAEFQSRLPFDTIYVNGNGPYSVGDPQYNPAQFLYDAAGYGLEITGINQTGFASVGLYGVAPQTFVNTERSVIFPPGKSGRSINLDWPR